MNARETARGMDVDGGVCVCVMFVFVMGVLMSDVCVGCGGVFGVFECVMSVRVLGGCWYARCFRCDDCGE